MGNRHCKFDSNKVSQELLRKKKKKKRKKGKIEERKEKKKKAPNPFAVIKLSLAVYVAVNIFFSVASPQRLL